MITFLKKVRQKLIGAGSLTKYSLYAIGEILLVVIGILIALQVNNWNEIRKERVATHQMLKNLLEDIQDDLDNIESLNTMLIDRKNHADYLLHIIDQPDLELENKKVMVSLLSTGWILNYTPTFATYSEIMNSGKLSLLPSAELKKALADYKSQTEENQNIVASYDATLKVVEEKALSYISPVPDGRTIYDSSNYDFSEYTIDMSTLRQDEDFVQKLKHISFISSSEVGYQENFIVTKAEHIKALILEEL